MNKEKKLEHACQCPDYLAVYGSELYGTATPESDHDLRGFVVPPFEYLFGFNRFDQRVYTTEDKTIWSLEKFLRLILRGDPQCYEMLWVPEDKVLIQSDVSALLRNNRHRFASLQFVRRVSGYAESEWRKVRGIQLKPTKRTPSQDEIIESIRFNYRPDKEDMDDIVKLLEKNLPKEEVSAKRNLGAKRKAQVEKYGYSTSSACHSLRLLGEAREFLLTGSVSFPRPDAEFLLAVKQGKHTYEKVEIEFNSRKTEIELLLEENKQGFPKKPDSKWAEGIYLEIIKDKIS